MTKKLYVGNLPFNIQNNDLEQLFAQAGAVESAKIIMDRDSGRSKGFGFVEMGSEDDAQKAINDFNGYELDGRAIRVNEAQDKPRGGDRGGDRGGRGGRGGYRD